LRQKYIDFLSNADKNCQKGMNLGDSDSLSLMLSLRMEGKCSIEGIHSLMLRLGYRGDSVGNISTHLREVGSKLGGDLGLSHKGELKYMYCSDEIFSRGQPILITVEPISMMILRIELVQKRASESWESHWLSLGEQGYEPIYLVKDEGSALSCAHERVFPDVPCQSDTFHAVAHRLGLTYGQLEKSAYNAIEREYKYLGLWKNTKGEESANKREMKYIAAKKEADKAIELFDNFAFLYHCLLDCFQVFDAQGKLKEGTKTKADFEVALQYLKTLNNDSINKQVKTIEACQKDLFYFTEIAQNRLAQLAQTMNPQVLQKLCLAWQTHKNAMKVKRNPQRKNALKRRENHVLEEVKCLIGQQYQAQKESTYLCLDQIVQSSAAVECLNSVLRPYLHASKNHISQEFLNLFMFYHNHRRFYAGKRKGKTPNEIFTQEPQALEWIDLIKLKIAR
jgi:hypothetical protein